MSGRVLLRASTAIVMSILGVGVVGTQAVAWARAETPAKPFTATQDRTITGLIPGGAAQVVKYTVTNLNDGPAPVRAVTMSITGVTYVAAAGTGSGTTWASHPAGGAAPGCAAANFAVVATAVPAQNLPPGNTSYTRLGTDRSASIAMVDTRVNQDNCKGVRIMLTITVV